MEKKLALKVGDFVERSISNHIQNNNLEPPLLGEEMEPKQWYKAPLENCVSGDGSEYYTYVSNGVKNNLCIILSGGGVAWNEYTAARPVTGAKVAAGLPNFYWNNLRPFTQIMNINIGITDIRNQSNPFGDWNFVVVTYATGDFHLGNNEFPYVSEDGKDEILYFNGYNNFNETMKLAKKLFPSPERILIAGNSAGAFAVPALAGDIYENYYSECEDITLFSDSGLLLFDDWKKTASQIWQAKAEICDAIHTDNITVDWYEWLYKRYGNKFRYLYGSSIRDYLLSAYYNDIVNKEYKTDKEVQQKFYEQLKTMVAQLKAINEDFRFYIFDWPMLPLTLGKGGTVHTALKEVTFLNIKQNGKTMAEWLIDQINGGDYSIGEELIRD